MSVYFIAIGGTGAKIAQAVVNLASAGLLIAKNSTPDKNCLHVFFVDPDKGNGNLQKTGEAINLYQECYQLLGIDQQRLWLPTKIEPERQPNKWSIISELEQKTLGGLFNYSPSDQTPSRYLFDVLYTKYEITENLDVGFKGRPAIGAAFISKLSQDTSNQETWKNLRDRIKNDPQPRIILCGSIFGGTGAAGLPTIGRLLKNELKETKIR
jgi:hypothetical protein